MMLPRASAHALRLAGLGTLLAAMAAALVLAFLAYLRPGFMVDLTNMVLAWCG